MADLYLLTKYSIKSENENNEDKKLSLTDYIKYMLQISIFVFAIYLSWTCNSKCEPTMNAIIKGIRAFFAGLFGFLYLIVYALFWSTDCNKCK